MCKRDEQDLLRFSLVPVNDVFELAHDGGGFPRSRARDDEVIVFIGNDGGALLKFLPDELLIVFTSQVLGIHAKGEKVLDGIDLLGFEKGLLRLEIYINPFRIGI